MTTASEPISGGGRVRRRHEDEVLEDSRSLRCDPIVFLPSFVLRDPATWGRICALPPGADVVQLLLRHQNGGEGRGEEVRPICCTKVTKRLPCEPKGPHNANADGTIRTSARWGQTRPTKNGSWLQLTSNAWRCSLPMNRNTCKTEKISTADFTDCFFPSAQSEESVDCADRL